MRQPLVSVPGWRTRIRRRPGPGPGWVQLTGRAAAARFRWQDRDGYDRAATTIGRSSTKANGSIPVFDQVRHQGWGFWFGPIWIPL